ncbi:MAG: glycosyltransferase family 2 protein [Candidatus Acidiferrum sp.]
MSMNPDDADNRGGIVEALANTSQPARSATGAAVDWPKITVVTAVRNGAKYIEDTIRSVVKQGYPNLEYIVVDGASTDGTLEIIGKYEEHISWWVSQPDNGLYDALNTGFARSSGEIMGWLNASDMLHPGGLAVVGSVFKELPEVRWITGRPSHIGEGSSTTWVGPIPRWSRKRYLAGANRYIQQESTYWRRDLWEQTGKCVDASRRDASDADLWVRFFRHAKLHGVDSLIGGYRKHADSIAAQDPAGYDRSLDEIVSREVQALKGERFVRAVRALGVHAHRHSGIAAWWDRAIIGRLYGWRGADWPAVIRNRNGAWCLSEE